jgi:hypothetical protein
MRNSVVRLLLDGQTATQYRVETDSGGRFQIPDVKPGKYTLRAYQHGFREGATTVNVVESEIADAGRVVLMLAGCDSPGTICDSVDPAPTEPPDVASGEVVLRPGCAVDLDKATVTCPHSADRLENRSDLKLDAGSEGAIYLTPINAAMIASCESKPRSEPIRIDGLGPGNDWCVVTNAKHHSHLFIKLKVVEPGADEVILWVVTRK